MPEGTGTGQGGAPGHDLGPYGHPAPGAPPSEGASGFGPAPTYQRPGAYGPPGYGPPGAYAGGGYGGYPPVMAYQNGAGGWALGLGIASLVVCMVPVLSQLVAIAALVTGFIGRNAANEGRANNGGMALAGIIIGAAVLVISVVLVIAWVWALDAQPY